MQETHAAPLDIQKSLNMLLQATSSCWSSYCGILSLNKNIIITPALSALDHRFLIGNVSHVHSKFSPFYIMTIYAPAEQSQRRKFFTSLAEFAPLVSILQSTSCRLLITGDFNYSPLTRHGAPPSWLAFLAHHMLNCMTRPLDTHPTFRRGSSLSTIDYIYATPSLHSSVCSPYIDFIHDQWTDHALLTVSLKLISDSNGPGLWRMNPNFLQNKRFVDALSRMLEEYASSLPLDITEPHLLWERLKYKIKQLARSFGRRHASWRTQQLRRLQSKRNRILRIFKQNGALNPLLEVVERQIGSLQSEIVRNNILRAGKHWREHGETSAGYLKRTIATRAASRYIPSLKDTPESECTSDTNEIQSIAKRFYRQLYSCDPVSSENLEKMLTHISIQNRLSSEASVAIMTPFSIDEILQASARCPTASSPGIDGLPYEVISLIFRTESLQPLILHIYNQALTSGFFPKSWTSTL